MSSPHPAAWHERRRAGIGSSDIAALLGLSPWGSPYSVWAEKVIGGGPGDSGSERMRWGLLLENTVLDEAARRLGFTITGRQVEAQHPANPWAIATIDATYAENRDGGDAGVLEAKTTSDTRWHEVPPRYEAQVQWQLEIRGLPGAWVACLHAGQVLSLWYVERDRDAGAGLLRIAAEFWARHVLTREPPPLDAAAATGSALARRYPASLPELAADLTPMAARLTRLREIHAAQAALKTERALIEHEIKAGLGVAEAGTVAGETAVTWRSHKRRTFDTTALREDHPALAEKYTIIKPARPLRLTGIKDTDD